mgnify:CR=1 FL=1
MCYLNYDNKIQYYYINYILHDYNIKLLILIFNNFLLFYMNSTKINPQKNEIKDYIEKTR